MPNVELYEIVHPSLRQAAGAVVQDDLDYDSGWHRHDMHQVQYAFEGAIEVESDTARYLMPRQLAAWIPAGVPHRTSVHRVRSGSIMLSPHMMQPAGDRVRIIEVSPLMREMILGAMRWPLDRPLDEAGAAYFTAFGLLCREWIGHEASLWLPTAEDAKLRAAMDHTRAHVVEADMASACRAAGLSERSLRRRFKQGLGMTWEAYRRRARLLAAVPLLSDGRRPIGAVAAEVGFESQSAFAKAFRSFTGKTPLAFRAGHPA